MQYLALIYADENVWATFSEDERQAAYAEYFRFGEEGRRLLPARVRFHGRGVRVGGQDPGRVARHGRGAAGLRRRGRR